MAGKSAESLFRQFPDTHQKYRQGNSASLLGCILEITSACLAAYPVVEYFTDVKYPNWTMAAMGVTLFMPALFISTAAGKNYQEAAEQYNLRKSVKTSRPEKEFEWAATPFALRFSWRF
ncbi:hypothetical protein K8S19_10790 [bacterium]|nr:hypothetical protein [bacterium]